MSALRAVEKAVEQEKEAVSQGKGSLEQWANSPQVVYKRPNKRVT